MRNYSKQWCSESNPHTKEKYMISIFNKIFGKKKTVSVKLAPNVSLTLTPATAGGCHATLTETIDIFFRRESCYFSTLEELTKSLRLTDNVIIKKLSKAF